MKILIAAYLCLTGIVATADQPITADVDFFVEANSSYVSSTGVWAIVPSGSEPVHNFVNISYVFCRREEMSCSEAFSFISSNKLKGGLISYKVSSWTATEIKAFDPTPCQTIELTFIIGSTEVIKVQRNGGTLKSDKCTAEHTLPNPIMMKLTSPEAAAKTMKN